MPLTKSAQALASTSNTAGSTTTTAGALPTGYGASGVAVVTNGGTAPTVPCDVVVDVSSDGGTTWVEWSRQTMSPNTASAVFRAPIGLALGGGGADFGSYRVRFTGNTAQAVTVQYDGSYTSAL